MDSPDRSFGVANSDDNVVSSFGPSDPPQYAQYDTSINIDTDIAPVHPAPQNKSCQQTYNHDHGNNCDANVLSDNINVLALDLHQEATQDGGNGGSSPQTVPNDPELETKLNSFEDSENGTQVHEHTISSTHESETRITGADIETESYSESENISGQSETTLSSSDLTENSVASLPQQEQEYISGQSETTLSSSDRTENSVASLPQQEQETLDITPDSTAESTPEPGETALSATGAIDIEPRLGPLPPSYEEATGGRHVPLIYVDFIPKKVDGVYEKFEVLISRANEWLSASIGYQVKNCECLELVVNGQDPDTDLSVFTEPSFFYRKYLRGLRLWLRYSANESSRPPERLHQINIVPPVIDRGVTQGYPTFLTLDRTLLRFNAKLRTQHIPGRVLNTVTQENLIKSGKTLEDPDTTLSEEAERYNYYYNSLKVFFVECQPTFEEVGYEDFVPALIGKTSQVFHLDEYEKIIEVVARAKEWISEQNDKRVTNIQTIDYKGNTPVKQRQPNAIDTNHSSRKTTHDEKIVVYLRFVRVYYTKVFYGDLPPIITPSLQYKTFVPFKTHDAGMLANDEFETQSETMERSIEWLNSAGISSNRVLSVETVGVRLYGGNQEGDPEQSLTLQSGGGIRSFLRVFRVFIDGDYQEPPATVLKPPPQVLPGKMQCCVVQ